MSIQTKPNKRSRTRDQLLAAAQQVLLGESMGALGIRQVTERAGLVHASFYNYYADIGALLDGLAELLMATHAHAVAPVRNGVSDPAMLFAATTRQTLRLFTQSQGFARLLFDSGMAMDRLLGTLQGHLRADLRAGARASAFTIANLDIAVTIVSGSILSLALSLHRRRARPAAIEELTQQLLGMLGVAPAQARAAAHAKIAFAAPPAIPMSWAALGLAAPEPQAAAA
jgi:AcrR family transcriptional regulator